MQFSFNTFIRSQNHGQQKKEKQWDNSKQQIRIQMKLRLRLIKDLQDRLYSLCELDSRAQMHFITKADTKMLHRVCNYFSDIICLPIFGFVNASLRGHMYHRWTPVQLETDAIVNYAGKCPPFSQSDGQPSATCLSYLWSSLGSWGDVHANTPARWQAPQH